LNSTIHNNIDKFTNSLGGQGAIKGFEHIFKIGSSSTIGIFGNEFK
jgi:hypothetical protein